MPALKALGMKPAEVLEVIKAATVKVVVVQASCRDQMVLMAPNDGGPRYLICNADEMEPVPLKTVC